eukprot:TRINITY_DN4562_c0_g1_i4.p1 TRINITY_DN4562_c0_g1~~TRINITY_DN4562_c0_g1_i4.p1  ORF type:complete len:226 (-),score=13.34 TRINITY_DN4562_c0_g1_i4:80-757(-)
MGKHVMEKLGSKACESHIGPKVDFESQFLQTSSEIDLLLSEVFGDIPTSVRENNQEACPLGLPSKLPILNIPDFDGQGSNSPDTPHFNFLEGLDLSEQLPTRAILERSNSTPRFGSGNDAETECSETEMQSRHSLPSSFTDYMTKKVPKCKKYHNRCQLCSDLISCVTLIPCGHSGVCEICSKNLKVCPFCGCKIRKMITIYRPCLLYTSPSPRDLSTSRMPSSA